MIEVRQSVAVRLPLKAYLASDHVSAATGKTIPVTISKNMAAFGNPSAGATNATERSNGWYYIDLSTTDTATLGPLVMRGTEGTIDDTETWVMVVAAGAAGGAPTVDEIADEVETRTNTSLTSAIASVNTNVETSLNATIADSIPADGTRPSIRQALYMTVQYLLERAVVGTTVTVKKADGTTALMTLTLDQSANPTSVTRAT